MAIHFAFQVIVLFALSACGYVGAQVAVADFNQGGVIGTIVFTRLENGSTQIDTSFSSGVFSGWHVHVYPADYTDDPATRCGSSGTGPHYDPDGRYAAAGANYSLVCNMTNPLMCEAGDLSGKFGPLQIGDFSFIDSDSMLQLRGQYGIIGRSVVIHAPVTSSRVACANIILQNDTPRIFVATFLGPVAGTIYFRQSPNAPEVGTFIYAKLFYTDLTENDTQGHLWNIYSNPLNVLDYSQGICNDLGTTFNPTNALTNAPGCSPSNIDACAVGDLSSKLGTISVNNNPIGGMINAWTDGNLHESDINGLSIGLRGPDGSNVLLACTNIVELPVTSGIVNTDRTLFTAMQRSPFDPTILSLGANIPQGTYQINTDGNVREPGNTVCYQNTVFQPFAPFESGNLNATIDSYPVGSLSSKHTISGGAVLSDTVLPLSNLYSALGHNVNAASTCGTLGFMSGDNTRIVQAGSDFNSDTMTGYVRLIQVFTRSGTDFLPGPTLMYWQLRYNDPGLQETVRHNWHVHVYRTADESPSTMCNGIIGGHFNPFNVEVGSAREMQVCNKTTGSRYQLRCELGDLSGKFGWLVIGSANSDETTVATDSNLPLTGPYTILGRSIAIHSDVTPSQIIACANIEPDVLSATTLQLSFPVDETIDVRIQLPVAIVDTLNDEDVEYGEVLVYELSRDSLRGSPQLECYTATLRFTDFEGNAELVASRVSQLNQNDLPADFRSGPCPNLLVIDDDTAGSAAVQPHIVMMVTALLGTIFMLGNILI